MLCSSYSMDHQTIVVSCVVLAMKRTAESEMKSKLIDNLTPWIVMTFALTQVLAPSLPQMLGWSSSIAERSQQHETPAVPFGLTFAIWGLIFIGSLAFSIFGLLRNQQSPLWRQLAWPAALLFALNTIWEVYVPLRNLDWFSIMILSVAAGTAITIALRIPQNGTLTVGERWCIAIPMQIYAGWLTAATMVGLPSTLSWANVHWIDPQSNLVAIVAVACVVLISGWVIVRTRAKAYAATIGWAIAGVAVANVVRDSRPVIVTAALLALLTVLSITVMASRPVSR
jgi:hypothetical protein